MSFALQTVDDDPPTLRPEGSMIRLRPTFTAPPAFTAPPMFTTVRSPSPAPSVGAWRDAHKRLERRAATLARHDGRIAQLGGDMIVVLHALHELWAAVLWEGGAHLDDGDPLPTLVGEVHAWASLVLQEFEEVVLRLDGDEDAWDVAGRSFTEESMLRVLAGIEPARDALERVLPGLRESAALRDAVAELHRNLRAAP